MIVKELIEQLKGVPENTQVFISGDPEGNDIRTIDGVFSIEVPRTNDSSKTYDALCIYPTDTIIDFPI